MSNAAIDDSQLITSVQSKDILFDKGHVFYKNLIKKELAWRTVARDCSSTVDAVRKRWKNLRDRFVRELKNLDGTDGEPPTNDDGTNTVWERYEQLKFLRNHVHRKKFGDTSSRSANNIKEESSANEECQNIFFEPGDNFDQTISIMFSADRSMQPDIIEGDDLLNEFLIRKKRETSSSPTSNTHKGINDAQLIASIKPRKCLYEKGNANYKNIAEKEKMWKKVAEECNAESVRVVRSRWKQLRDRFGREIKVTSDPSRSSWKLFADMLFIKDHVNVRNCASMLSNQETTDNQGQSANNRDGEEEENDVKPFNYKQLIDTIRDNSILYDEKSLSFTNVPRKELIWADISKNMNCDVTSLKVYWGELQEKYVQELTAARDNKQASIWPYFEDMSFMKYRIGPYAEQPTHTINITTDLQALTGAAGSIMLVADPLDALLDCATTTTTNTTAASSSNNSNTAVVENHLKRSHQTMEDSPELETRIIQTLKRVLDERGDQLTNQEDEHFGRFITEKLKSFPKKMRNEAKSHIINYLIGIDNTLPSH